MSASEIEAESKEILKNVLSEVRTRRSQEAEEYYEMYESDEELCAVDVHETKDEELEKKLTPLDQINESYTKVCNEFMEKNSKLTAEELAKDEAEAIKEEEEDDKSLAEQVISS